MSTLSAERLERLRSSRESASGSSDWHAARTKRSAGAGAGRDLCRSPGMTIMMGSPTTLTFPPTSSGSSSSIEEQKRQRQRQKKEKEAAVTITPEKPGRCRVRKGNGDGDGLRGQNGLMVERDGEEDEGGFGEVAVTQRMGRCPRKVDGFSRYQ